MTDTGSWPDLIHVARIMGNTEIIGGVPVQPASEYVMIPLNPYQMGNLIDALAQVAVTGDWYGEFCDIIAVAMLKSALTELSSNRGHVYTYEQIRARLGSGPRPLPLPHDRR
jgi:hypothetical protein